MPTHRPSAVDPSAHIHWRGEYPKAAPGSQEGRATIEVVGLDRDELVQFRREHLQMLRALVAALNGLRERGRTSPLSAKEQKALAKLERQVEALRRDTAPYAAMARAAVA